MCGNLDYSRQRCRGLTIAEMWLALSVSCVVLAALLSFSVYTAKSFAALTNYVDLEQKSQNALDTMTRDVRQTKCLVGFSTTTLNGRQITNALTFLDSDDRQLSYTFQNGALVRSKAGVDKMLLTNCDFMTFQIYQRNPMSGTYEQYPSGSVTNCKLISVSWICSRSILGSKLNTESVQTAKIVIRKS